MYGQYAPRLRLEGQAGYGLLRQNKLSVPDFPFYEETQTGYGPTWQLVTHWRLTTQERLFLALEIGQQFWPDWQASGNLTPEKMPEPDPYLTDPLARSAQAFQFGVGISYTPLHFGRMEPWFALGLRYQILQIEQNPRTLRVEGQQTRFVWQEAGYELLLANLGLRVGAGLNFHLTSRYYLFLRAHAQGNWQGQTELLPATFRQFDATLGLGIRLFPSPSRFR